MPVVASLNRSVLAHTEQMDQTEVKRQLFPFLARKLSVNSILWLLLIMIDIFGQNVAVKISFNYYCSLFLVLTWMALLPIANKSVFYCEDPDRKRQLLPRALFHKDGGAAEHRR